MSLVGIAKPTAPFVIRFEDWRRVAFCEDREYATEQEARDGWANLKRKNSKTNAELWINGEIVGLHHRKFRILGVGQVAP